MSGILMMIIAIVVLGGAYLIYMDDILQTNGELTPMPKPLLMNWKMV